MEAPATVASCMRRMLLPRSKISCSGMVSLDSASCRIGTLEALYESTNGGVVPGGEVCSCVCETAVICAKDRSWFDVRLEEIFDHRRAVDRLRFGVLDVVDHGLRGALREQHDAVGHFLRQQARIAPDDRRNGNLDVGEDVGGRAQDGEHAEEHDQRRQHRKRVGPLQRYSDNPHTLQK